MKSSYICAVVLIKEGLLLLIIEHGEKHVGRGEFNATRCMLIVETDWSFGEPARDVRSGQ